MYKDEFDYMTRKMAPLEDGGVKKACFIVQEYNKNKGEINPITGKSLCAVTEEEYNDAISVLTSFAYNNSTNETKTELYKCTLGYDCNPTSAYCKGEFSANNHLAKKLCPHRFDPYQAGGDVLPHNSANLE